MVESDRGPERVADEIDIVAPKMFEQGFEVEVEGPDLTCLGIRGITMAPEIEGVNRSSERESRSEMIPPMRVGTSSMQENQGWSGCFFERFRCFPKKTMQLDSIVGHESNGVRLGWHVRVVPGFLDGRERASAARIQGFGEIRRIRDFPVEPNGWGDSQEMTQCYCTRRIRFRENAG